MQLVAENRYKFFIICTHNILVPVYDKNVFKNQLTHYYDPQINCVFSFPIKIATLFSHSYTKLYVHITSQKKCRNIQSMHKEIFMRFYINSESIFPKRKYPSLPYEIFLDFQYKLGYMKDGGAILLTSVRRWRNTW